MFFLNATNPETIKLARKVMLEWGFKAQRLGNRTAARLRERTDGAAAGDDRQAAAERAGRAFREQEDAGRLAEENGARAARHRGSPLRADHSRSRAHDQRVGRGVLFPRLRLGAAVLASRSRDAGDAVARRCADRAAAGLSVLRLSAARRRSVRQGREDHHRQPRAVPSRREHAQLSRHQDGRRQLRHVLRPVAGLQIRRDLSRLPHHRHPRVPDGARREARGRDGRALHVSRSVSLADQEPRSAEGRERADQRQAQRQESRRTIAAAASPALSPSRVPMSRRRCASARSRRCAPAPSACAPTASRAK